MKQSILSLILILGVKLILAQSSPVFNATQHAFGKIKQGKPVTYVFNVKNPAAKPLIIEAATAECGCTTPEFSKAPILKDKTSNIKVTFNAANVGPFTKKVTVKFFDVAQPTILTISGEVLKPKAK